MYGLLQTDAQSVLPGTLGDIGVLPGSIYAAEAADDIKKFPFVTMRWGNILKGVGKHNRQFLDVFAHNRDRDYLLIDAILFRIRNLLGAAEAIKASEGSIIQIDWQGDGPDAHDDGYDTVVRNSTYVLIGDTR